MKLVLIRHAASEHALNTTIAGMIGCTGLSTHGVEQARALSERLTRTAELEECTVLLSSPVRRAWHTAEHVLTSVAAPTITECHGLCELHPGQADGMQWQDYRATYGEFDMLAFPHRPFAPLGESWYMFTLFNIPRPGTRAWLNPTHTSLTEWTWSKGMWQLVRYNDVAHLLA